MLGIVRAVLIGDALNVLGYRIRPYEVEPGSTDRALEQAKGYRATKNSSYKRAKEQVQRSGQYAYRDRRVRKREFRKLWIIRLNDACRERGLRYSQFIAGLEKSGIILDRKSLSEIAIADPAAVDVVMKEVKAALGIAA